MHFLKYVKPEMNKLKLETIKIKYIHMQTAAQLQYCLLSPAIHKVKPNEYNISALT